MTYSRQPGRPQMSHIHAEMESRLWVDEPNVPDETLCAWLTNDRSMPRAFTIKLASPERHCPLVRLIPQYQIDIAGEEG
jgi:hypothetical protein